MTGLLIVRRNNNQMKYLGFLFAVIFFSCQTPVEAQQLFVAGTQTAQKFEKTVPLNYLLYLPDNYDPERKEGYPTILFLHGAGERGDDVSVLTMWGPPKIAAEKGLPFIVISPQCPKGHWWTSMMFPLKSLLDYSIETYNIDTSRIYLTGLSMGGYGTFAFSLLYPGYFAAVAPMCGGGTPSMVNFTKDYPPVWVFHGDADKIVPISSSQIMVDKMKDAGYDVKFTVYKGGDHYMFQKAYREEGLFDWFLEHKKGK